METDAGRAVMKRPARKARALFKVVLPMPVATTLSLFPGLSTITWQRSTRSDLHALDAAYPETKNWFKLFQIKGRSDRLLEHISMLIFLKERALKFKITWLKTITNDENFESLYPFL